MSDPNYWGDVQREQDRDHGYVGTNYLAWCLFAVGLVSVIAIVMFARSG